MGDDIVMTAFRWFFQLLKWILPFLWKSGLLWPMAVSLLAEAMGPSVPPWLYAVAYTLAYYLMIQSIMRWVKKDKKLKLWRVILGKNKALPEDAIVNPKANAGLTFQEPQGLVFGKLKKQCVCKPEITDGHAIVVGGPGSGKTSSVIIPSLLRWQSPVFAIDIKGELYEKTGHIRSKSKVFSLSLPNGCGYNPYYLINENRNLVEQIRQIAIALCPVPAEEKNPFWKNSAQNFLAGCLLWGYLKKIPFAEIMVMIQGIPPAKMAEAICADSFEEPKLFMNTFVDMAPNTLSGVYTEVSNTVLPFATDPQLRAALSKPRVECIFPADLDNGVSIYVHMEEHRLEELRGLLTLMVNQFLKHFEQRSEKNSNRVLFLLDEFPRLSRIESVLTGMATLRSKGITVCLAVQSLAQLDVTYGQAQRKVILDNASYIAILRVTDTESAKVFSDMVGSYDRTKKSYSDNQQDLKMLGSSGTSTTTELRKIIQPEEFNRLDDQLILVSPYGFNRLHKEYYFKSDYFQKLLQQK